MGKEHWSDVGAEAAAVVVSPTAFRPDEWPAVAAAVVADVTPGRPSVTIVVADAIQRYDEAAMQKIDPESYQAWRAARSIGRPALVAFRAAAQAHNDAAAGHTNAALVTVLDWTECAKASEAAGLWGRNTAERFRRYYLDDARFGHWVDNLAEAYLARRRRAAAAAAAAGHKIGKKKGRKEARMALLREYIYAELPLMLGGLASPDRTYRLILHPTPIQMPSDAVTTSAPAPTPNAVAVAPPPVPKSIASPTLTPDDAGLAAAAAAAPSDGKSLRSVRVLTTAVPVADAMTNAALFSLLTEATRLEGEMGPPGRDLIRPALGVSFLNAFVRRPDAVVNNNSDKWNAWAVIAVGAVFAVGCLALFKCISSYTSKPTPS